jgi:acetyltransferase-like isoleucine patch superfamily enzyme
MQIAASAIIYPNVQLGEGAIVEDFCIIGAPPNGISSSDSITVIGSNAHIRSHTVIYAGNVIGDHFATGNKANIRESCVIGDDVSVGTLSVIEHHVQIGARSRLHSQVFIPEYSKLGEAVWIGPNAVLTNARYPTSVEAKRTLVGPILEDYCRIGANSTILPGVRIGAQSLIGAGSLVTHDVPAGMVAYGAPALVKRPLASLRAYSKSHPDEFDSEDGSHA